MALGHQKTKVFWTVGAVRGLDADGCWVDVQYTDRAMCTELTDRISIMQQAQDKSWRVAGSVNGHTHKAYGDTIEQAVARCVVLMQLGHEAEVPDELAVQADQA
ncbi:MAG: hypothetical protein RLY58_2427, partial [Pseudomonadota bacterium]|jgi:hypothetical protein